MRVLVLVVLLLAVATAIWTATTKTLLRATENVSLDGLEVETRHARGGATMNVVEEDGGSLPVVLLHGYDISGGILWDGVISQLDERYHAIRIDLPGFGMSDRLPEEGPGHTVASMAEVVAAVLKTDVGSPVVIVGVGLGGEVAAELAVTKPDLVRGIVMVDVDFWEARSWLKLAERLPWVGEAVTYTFETGGRMGVSQWAPWCEEGGWCPTQSQANARELASSISSSTDSMRSFLRTPAASLVPSDLGLIDIPVAYVWSSEGIVPRDSVDRIEAAVVGEFSLVSVAAYQAQLEEPGMVAAAVESVDS